MSIFRKWRRRAENDEDALRKVLEKEPPLGAADIPVQINFGWGEALGQLSGFFAPVLGLLLVHLVFGLDLRWALFIAGIFSLFNLASLIPDFTSLIRAITISGEGVRVEKLHRSYVIPWWRVRSMQATPDLLKMLVIGWEERALISTETLDPDRRVEIAHGLRARARQHGVDLEEWPRGDRIRRQIIPGIISIAGVLAVVAGIYFWFPGGTLGMRCSVNSAFLQETFGTPNRQGCVVLRVSAGAEKAGIQRGDLVIEMEGIPVTSGQQFQYVFDTTDPPWTFAIIRSGVAQPLQFKVRGGRGENFREDASDPFFYYLRARWDASEKPQQAIRDYSRAIELEPRFDLAYLYRGDLYKEAGDHEAARKDYLTAIEMSPDLGEAHSHYAYFVDEEDPLTAEEHIRRAVELNRCEGGFQEHNIDCADNYVLLAHLLSDASEMARVAEEGISFFDGFADNYFNAMCAYSYLGDDARAKSYADRYLKFSKSKRTTERTAIAEGVREGTREC
jgi:Tetratricopeptide repeat